MQFSSEEKEICIICNKPIINKSVEHIFPKALGGKITINSVCKECNDKLGANVDSLLTENSDFLSLRNKYEIPDRRGNKVNILKKLKLKNYVNNNDICFVKTKNNKNIVMFEKVNNNFKTIETINGKIRLVSDIEYNTDKYKPLGYKIFHEFLHYQYGGKYRNTSLYNTLSNYLNSIINEETVNCPNILGSIMLNQFTFSENKLLFSIEKSKNLISIGINMFDYLLIVMSIENSEKYDFVDNYSYIN